VTSTSLAHRNAHLLLHRRMILGRSIAAGAVGLTPVTFLDEWLSVVIRRETIRRVADARGIDLDEAAARAVAEGVVSPPGWRTVVSSTPIARLLRRSWRRVFLAVAVYRRADDAARHFAVATLFDHYCARVHVGGLLDVEAGKRVRARIDAALQNAPRGMGTEFFRRGFALAARTALWAPLALAGAVARLGRDPSDEVVAEEVVGEALEPGEPRTFVARALATVDRQLGAAGRAWIDGLVEAFEEAAP
jgi:hypothetical protein